MLHTIRSIMLVLLASLCCASPALAQENPSEGIARVVLITPKEGHRETLVKAITEYHHWIANFEGHHVYQWYEIQTGPDSGKYIARSAGHNWADFDAEPDWMAEADEAFATNVAPHVQDADVWFTQDMPEFSHWPESFEGYTHFFVEDWYVRNGQYGNFRRGLQRISEALKAGGFGAYWGFYSVESGGKGGQIQLVTANKGWADMAESEPTFFAILSEALGGPEAFDAFMSDWGSSFEVGTNRMVELMPEASDYGQ